MKNNEELSKDIKKIIEKLEPNEDVIEQFLISYSIKIFGKHYMELLFTITIEIFKKENYGFR
jgi:hypothetical protein